MKGRIKDILKTMDGKFRTTFEVDSVDELRGMEDKEVSIEVSVKKPKRSLNANAYFHVLVGKIADVLSISKQRSKNMLMGRYGQREIINGEIVELMVISDCDMMEREDIHCTLCGYDFMDGKKFNRWAVVKPSHLYDTREMSVLINGTVDEAKELGIETLSPAELARMMNGWNQYCKKNESAISVDIQ